MDVTSFAAYNRQIETLIGAATRTQIAAALQALADQEQWELLGLLLLTATEAGARGIVTTFAANRRYEPLAWGACLRRQLRPSIVSAAGRGPARSVLRDIDAEEGVAGVPEHITADINYMATVANQQRQTAQQRDAQLDRCPIRAYIVEQLAQHLNEESAREAILTIAKACVWEETRRDAALKLANHQPSVQALLAANRCRDLMAISNAAALKAVARNMAAALARKLAELQQAGDTEALAFIAQNHADASTRQAAEQAML